MKKICVVCKKEFNTSHKKIKCCSRDCSNELKRINKYNEMSERVNEDFATWLKRKYENEKLSVREISVILYGNNKNNYYILECLKNFDINVRHGSEAISTQYIGEKGEKRKEILRNPNLTDEERENKRSFDGYDEWRKQVFERDNYTCQCCKSSKSGTLNAHHKDGFHWCIERRLDITNGVTLCEDCHKEFHKIYGKKDNTEQQFEEFMNNNKKEVS